MYAPFQGNQFTIRKQILAFTGIFRIYDANEQVIAYSKQKMFRLREDIRVYTDEEQSQELLYIQARSIIDFSAAYDVFDSVEGVLVGTLQRRGLRSIMRDAWDVLDASGQMLGELIEDSLNYAMLRRFLLGHLLPQNYDVLFDGQKVMDLRQRFHMFRYELDLDFSGESLRRIDHRLGIAAGILLGVIEGKQESG